MMFNPLRKSFTCARCPEQFTGDPSECYKRLMIHMKENHKEFYDSVVLPFYGKSILSAYGCDEKAVTEPLCVEVFDKILQGKVHYLLESNGIH